MNKISTQKLVFMALFAAATTVATYSLKFPSGHGYFNLGEIVIYASALTFGPVVGAVAGALGSGLADLFGGYIIPWAPITFLVKGLEGYLVGRFGHNQSVIRQVTAILIGGLAIIIGYPVATGLIYGWAAALPELYMAIGQVVLGAFVGLPLSIQLKKIFNQNDTANWGS